MDVEKHVASCVADGCVRMGGGVVNEPEEFVVGVVRGFGMLGGDGSNCDQHPWIDSDGIIQRVPIICWTRLINSGGMITDGSGLLEYCTAAP